MKKLFLPTFVRPLMIITVIQLIYFSQWGVAQGTPKVEKAFETVTSAAMENLSINVVYDNNPYKAGLATSWGFACVIRGAEKTILFDTGGDSIVLLDNMQQVGIDPKEIDVVVLSHIHGDHVGGLNGFLKANSKVAVFLPATFPLAFKQSLKRSGIKTIEGNDPVRICKDVYSTGVLGAWIKEQALMVSTDNGMVVITGCAHPGLVNILKAAKDILKDDIHLAMGGFHLGAMSKTQLEKIITTVRKLGVKRVGPCHCSGDLARRMFKREYGNSYMNVGVGRLIELP